MSEGPPSAAAKSMPSAEPGAGAAAPAARGGDVPAFTPAVRGLNLLHRAVDESIRRQLEPGWHSVGWRARQIVKVSLNLRGLPVSDPQSGSKCTLPYSVRPSMR